MQQLWRVEPIGTLGHTLPAVQAVFDLVHLLLPLFGQPFSRGRSSNHKGNARTLVDLNSGRTRHAVSAAPAEPAAQLLAVLFNSRPALVRKLRALADALQKLVELAFALYAPDGNHALLRLHPCRSRQTVADKAASHALHGDEAHMVLAAFLHKLQLLRARQIAERKL